MKAAIYCRISLDREGAGLGVERQRTDCVTLAEQRQWQIVGTYVDNDVSAFSGKKRPEYRRLLRDVQQGGIDVIVAWHTDRLHRSPRELEEFIDLCDAKKVRVETVRAGELDLRTPAGRAVARTLGAWARYESEHRSDRVRRKMVELAQRGISTKGGERPYGYAKDRITLVPEEAAALKDAAERVLAGETLYAIVKDFNDRGLVTTAEGKWTSRTLRGLLLRPRIAGLIEHPTAGRVRGEWPAIVSEAQHARLTAVLSDPARRRPGRPRRYLLSGISRCGECGAPLIGHMVARRHDKVAVYYCKGETGCGKVAIAAHRLEPFVVEAVLSSLERLRITPEEEGGDDDAEIADATADRDQLEELASLYAARTITSHEWIRARTEIEERIAERNRRIAKKAEDHRLHDLLTRQINLGEAWPSLPVEQQRDILRAVLDRVLVARRGKSPVFDPSRITMDWRV